MRLVSALLFASLSIFAIEPAQPKLTWSTILELVDESTGAWSNQDVEAGFSIAFSSVIVGGGIAAGATNRAARTAGAAGSAVGTALLAKVFFGARQGDGREQERSLRQSPVYKGIVDIAAARRAVVRLAIEKAVDENSRTQLAATLVDDERKIKEAMTKLPGGSSVRPIPLAATH